MDANGLRFWMLSQSTDWMAPWRTRSPYVAGQSLVDPNGNIQTALTSGLSDAAEPNWSVTPGQTTPGPADAQSAVTWKNGGPGTWQASTVFPTGQYILDPANNLQIVATVSNPAQPAASADTAPLWPAAFGQTVADGNLVWRCAGPPQNGLAFCPKTHRLTLRSARSGKAPVEDFFQASALVETVPMTLDQFDNYARWDVAAGMVMGGGSGPDTSLPDEYGNPPSSALSEVPIYLPARPNVTDLAMGSDGILYVAAGGSLVMVDRRGRWQNFTLDVPGVTVWRLAALPGGGVLILDRTTPQLAVVTGQPLRDLPSDSRNPGILGPCQANDNPPHLASLVALPSSEVPVALAPVDTIHQPGKFAVLSWQANSVANTAAYLRLCTATPATVTLAPTRLQLFGVLFPYAIAGLAGTPTGAGKIAVLATSLNEALVYDLLDPEPTTASAALPAAGDTYILNGKNLGPFVHTVASKSAEPPLYANADSTSAAPALPLYLPLLPLSLNSVAPTAATHPTAPSIIDSGNAQNTWHRLFVEALFPPRCGAIVWLAASDSLTALYDPATPWFPHLLGDASLSSIPTARLADAPTAVWQTTPTEVSFGPTLLKADPIPNRQGLFMALVQRPDKAVRSLSGRFLGVRIQLNGDGRNTPEIAGLRIYGTRFSYVQNYLPELYRESTFGPDANVDGPSTQPDFLERFVDLFESQFTRIEDSIANSYLLTCSESAPDTALPWLGSWIGIQPDDNYPPTRSRARLKATPSLYQWRGTTRGLTEALDVATNGMCRRGAIVLVEDFRLRHIFATILGADLAIKDDPLLPGYSASSNSIVGDTLFLGDPSMQAELQALYAQDLHLYGGAAAEKQFYDALANRLTIFIHDQVESIDAKLITRIVEAEKPAHIKATLLKATQPLLIGLASLVGVNTYVAPDSPLENAAVDRSDIGRHDIVTYAPTLDPRMENGIDYAQYALPIARITGPAISEPTLTITLDGSASTSPSGTNIQSYQWTLLAQSPTT